MRLTERRAPVLAVRIEVLRAAGLAGAGGGGLVASIVGCTLMGASVGAGSVVMRLAIAIPKNASNGIPRYFINFFFFRTRPVSRGRGNFPWYIPPSAGT
jgi:hypothetical protein